MKNIYARICSLKILFTFFCVSNILFAQSPIPVTSLDSIGKFEAIPNDLAFELLGLSGNNIQQPGTLSKLLASVQPVIDKKGSLSPGLAVSFAPYQLIKGDQLQLKDYVDDNYIRFLSNIQLSLGSAPSINADSSQDWGIGIRLNILNTGDGRLNKDHIDQLVESAMQEFGEFPVGKSPTLEIMKFRSEALDKRVKVNNYIASFNSGDSIDVSGLEKELGGLEAIADSLIQLDSITYKVQPKKSILTLKNQLQKTKEVKSIKRSITEKKDTSSWNTTSLDLSIGTVYRASQSKIGQSEFDKFRIWLNGGVGTGSFQILGQIGYFQQFKNSVMKDSNYISSALVCRYGNKDFRFGFGANGKDLKSGSLITLIELRVSDMGWIVASFNRDIAKGVAPTWNPSMTFKTTGLGL